MADRSISPSDYKITKAVITSDRLGSYEFDVTASIVDITIIEQLDGLALHGEMTILDDANLLGIVDFQGTEYIDFEMGLTDDVQPHMKRRFVITELISSAKSNDQSEILMFSLDTVDSFINAVSNVNKVYDGTPAQIIQKIAKDNFGLDKEVLTNDELFQGPMRVIIPNWSPYVAMRWVADRATSALGTPYFLYSVLGDNRIRLIDLQSLLEGTPLNETPYRYNQGAAQNMSENNLTLQTYNIKSYAVHDTENTVDIAYEGGISGEYRFIDTTTFQQNLFNYDVNKVYNDLARNTNLFKENSTPNYDKEFTINNKKVHEFNTSRSTQIGTSKVYNDIPSYHEDLTPEAHSKKATSVSMRSFLEKSAMEISIPGYNMFYSGSSKFANVSIGNLIKVEFLDNEPKQAGNNLSENAPDGKRSGVYLIQSCKHIINNVNGKYRYDCVLRILKISNRAGSTTSVTAT